MIHFPGASRVGASVVSEEFEVKYDGPGLANHAIDVRDLGPALLALGEMFSAAHQVVSDGFTPPPTLRVTANRGGSFAVDLLLEAWTGANDLFGSKTATNAATAVGLMSPVFYALMWVRKTRGKRDAAAVELAAEPGMLEVQWPDGTRAKMPVESQDIVNSMDFRRAAREAIEPVTREGITSVRFADRGKDKGTVPEVTVAREDWRSFDQLPGDERLISDRTSDMVLRMIRPSFVAGQKWQVSDGGGPFWVSIHDLDFLSRIESNDQRLAAHDLLDCSVRVRQYAEEGGGLRTERDVLKVRSVQTDAFDLPEQ